MRTAAHGGGCDTMVALGAATANGQTLFAKNSDRSPDECQPLVLRPRQSHLPGERVACAFVSVPQVETTWRHVGSQPYWCWGYEHGFNEHQVVIGNEALRSRLSFSEPKLLGMEILRLALERACSAPEAVDVIGGLVERWGQGRFPGGDIGTYDNGFIVADPRTAFVVETAGHYWAARQVADTEGISNVYALCADWDRLSPQAESAAREAGWWSLDRGRLDFAEAFADPESRVCGSAAGARRRARSCTVLRGYAGRVDARLMMALLSDHSDGEQPDEPLQTAIRSGGTLCMHCAEDGSGGNTAASLVADLCADGSRLPVYWCSFYSPCLGIFLPVFLEGELPEALSQGGPDAAAGGPWWGFHHLSRLARADPEARVPVVRSAWARLQDRFLSTAYVAARDGAALLRRREREAASRLLSSYMAENTQEVLSTLAALTQSLSA